jgi:hypothetical protein
MGSSLIWIDNRIGELSFLVILMQGIITYYISDTPVLKKGLPGFTDTPVLKKGPPGFTDTPVLKKGPHPRFER